MTRSDPVCSYILPFRRTRFDALELAALGSYFQSLARAGCEVLVIDGSPAEIFAENAAALKDSCRHEGVDPQFGYPNGKVNGVHTGVQRAACEKIVLADDDIRYTAASIAEVVRLLNQYEVVRPQNFLAPLPWWAKSEAARMLINRSTLRAADYPGTCAFLRSSMERVGHYDGDVLFDNEEIIRHFARQGAAVYYATDLFVEKQAPSLRKWLEQRPRQAYEDFGLRAKTAAFFALPAVCLSLRLKFGWGGSLSFLGTVSILSILLAFRGRSRGAGAQFFPRSACFAAPFWVVERAFSTYWALYWYAAHGGYPFGDRILSKGTGRDWRFGGRIASHQLREHF